MWDLQTDITSHVEIVFAILFISINILPPYLYRNIEVVLVALMPVLGKLLLLRRIEQRIKQTRGKVAFNFTSFNLFEVLFLILLYLYVEMLQLSSLFFLSLQFLFVLFCNDKKTRRSNREFDKVFVLSASYKGNIKMSS